jgi:hypothetical protein
MAPTLNRLLHLGRRRPEPDRPPEEPVTVDIDALPLEGATVGTVPMLRPAAIFHQVLFDPTEFTPAWLQPRPAAATGTPGPSDPIDHQTAVADSGSTDTRKAPKRARRPKTSPSPAASRPRSKRIAKPDQGGAAD